MSETIIDYNKTNQYLPASLRDFVGSPNRVMRQNFFAFMPLYEGVEQMAVFNNRLAAEFASGFTELNYMYLRSGTAPRLLDIFTNKAVGRVWYQAEKNNEEVFNEKVDSDFMSDKLSKATKEAAMTGRSLMVLYKNDDDNVEIETYNLFRHKCYYDYKRNVKEAFIYIVKSDYVLGEDSYSNVICEHRFYGKVTNKETNKKEYKPFKEFIVYLLSYERGDTKKAKTRRLNNDEIKNNEMIAKSFPDVKFNAPEELPFDSIGVYDIKFSLTNKKFIDSDIPEAMFVDAIDNGVILDTSITDKEVEKETGRARIMFPDFEGAMDMGFISQGNAGGRVLRTVSVKFKSPIMSSYPSRSMEDSKPQNVQFDIRSDQWISQVEHDTCRLCASVGISVLDFDPRLLQTGQRTDDEINAMTDITANTITSFRNINQYKINQMLTDIANFYKLNVNVSIRWSMASILNPSKNTDLVIRQLQNGLISQKEAIQRANPDLRPQEVEDLYKTIQAERGAEAVENNFNRF